MKIPLDRFVSFFATLFIPMMPLLAGIVTCAGHDIVVDAIAKNAATTPLPPSAQFIFNHFHTLIWGLFWIALALTIASLAQIRIKDPVERVTRQLILAIAGASLGGGFLAIYFVAAAHALAAPHAPF